MSDSRANAYWEGSTLILRASSFGGCIGALVRSAQGLTASPPPAKMLERFEQGNTAEPIIVEELKRRGFILTNTHSDDGGQLELGIDIAGKVVIRCHPDGLINRTPDDAEWPLATEVLEIKALRPSFDRGFRPYEWQNSIEVAASGFGLCKVYGEKDEHGELVRDSEGNVELDIVPQPHPTYSLVEIKRRALEIYRAALNGRVVDCDLRQYPCGFYREEGTLCHWSPESKAAERAKVEELPIPEAKVAEYIGMKADADQMAADVEELKTTFKDMVKDRPGDKYRAGRLMFTKSPGRKTLDRKALEKAHPDIDFAQYEKTGKPSWRMDITESDASNATD